MTIYSPSAADTLPGHPSAAPTHNFHPAARHAAPLTQSLPSHRSSITTLSIESLENNTYTPDSHVRTIDGSLDTSSTDLHNYRSNYTSTATTPSYDSTPVMPYSNRLAGVLNSQNNQLNLRSSVNHGGHSNATAAGNNEVSVSRSAQNNHSHQQPRLSILNVVAVPLPRYSRRELSAIFFYAAASFAIVVLNKIILSHYDFKAVWFMTLSHQVVSLLMILLMKVATNQLQNMSLYNHTIAMAAIPLAITFAVDVILGMIALQYVAIPMFTALRRLTTLFNVILQYVVFNQLKSRSVLLCIAMMVIGALVAGYGDLQYDLLGYVIVFGNNLTTAGRQTLVKWLANRTAAVSSKGNAKSQDKKDTNQSLQTLYYNALLSIPLLAAGCFLTGEIHQVREFPSLYDAHFQLSFLVSAVNAFLVNYSSNLCTVVTDQTTTSVTGQAKNLFTMMFSILFMSKAWPTPSLLMGLTIGIIGSTMYFQLDELGNNKKKPAALSAADQLAQKSPTMTSQQRHASEVDLEASHPLIVEAHRAPQQLYKSNNEYVEESKEQSPLHGAASHHQPSILPLR